MAMTRAIAIALWRCLSFRARKTRLANSNAPQQFEKMLITAAR